VSTGAAVALVLVAGLVGSMQVAVMGRFGERIGSLEAFAFATVVTAALALVALLAVRRSLAGVSRALDVPPWLWLGGLFGGIVVLTITITAPKLGTTAVVGLLFAGQLAMGVVIDRFGLFGLERIGLSWPRAVGVVLLAVGAALALRK
jgi:bacterial/archaeal transporter family-2 protein